MASSLGWIKLHRSTNEWGWKKDPNVMALWVHLLTNSNFEDGYFMGSLIKKGSLATGLISLSEKTGLSIQQTRTALKKLKSTNEITIKSTNKFSIISIVKWFEYQDDNKQVNKPSTNEQQTINKPSTTIKEPKKLRSKEVNKPDDVSEQVWIDFLKHRKIKRADVSETVISRTRQEAEKVKWTLEQALIETCSRGWVGFSARYLTENHGNAKGEKNGKQKLTRSQQLDLATEQAIAELEAREFQQN